MDLSRLTYSTCFSIKRLTSLYATIAEEFTLYSALFSPFKAESAPKAQRNHTINLAAKLYRHIKQTLDPLSLFYSKIKFPVNLFFIDKHMNSQNLHLKDANITILINLHYPYYPAPYTSNLQMRLY